MIRRIRLALVAAAVIGATLLVHAGGRASADPNFPSRMDALRALSDPTRASDAVKWLTMPERVDATLDLLRVLLQSEASRRSFADVFGDAAVPALVRALEPEVLPQIVPVYWLALTAQEAPEEVARVIRERLRDMPSAPFTTGVKAWAAAGDTADTTAQIETIRRTGRYEAVARGLELGERTAPGAHEAAIRLLAAAAMTNRTRAREAVRTANIGSAWRVELNDLFVAMRAADPLMDKARDRAMRTRVNSIRALVNDRANGRLHFYMLMSDRDASVRRETLNHAGRVLGPARALRMLIETLSYDPDWQVREAAHAAIRDLDPLPAETAREVASSQPPRLGMLLNVLAHTLDPEASFSTRTERIDSLRAFQHQMSRRFGSSRYGSNARRNLTRQISALRAESGAARLEWQLWWNRNRSAFQGEPPVSGHAPAYADGFGP